MGATTTSLLVSPAPLELLVRPPFPSHRTSSLPMLAPPFAFFTEHTCHQQAQQSLGNLAFSKNQRTHPEPLHTKPLV
jgi:hypothetical protein